MHHKSFKRDDKNFVLFTPKKIHRLEWLQIIFELILMTRFCWRFPKEFFGIRPTWKLHHVKTVIIASDAVLGLNRSRVLKTISSCLLTWRSIIFNKYLLTTYELATHGSFILPKISVYDFRFMFLQHQRVAVESPDVRIFYLHFEYHFITVQFKAKKRKRQEGKRHALFIEKYQISDCESLLRFNHQVINSSNLNALSKISWNIAQQLTNLWRF